MDDSAVVERSAHGRCLGCGAKLVSSHGTKVTTRPDGICAGPTR